MKRDPQLLNGIVIYDGPMQIDCDGSPRAYSNNGKALDFLANAGSTGNWWGVATDTNGEPFIQGAEDPCPGFYVSTTALQRHDKSVSDPARYVDSEQVNYISCASDLIKKFGIHLGDIVAVYYRETSTLCAAIVGDIGPKLKYGEGSIALASALGMNSSPKHGGCSEGVITIIFVGSHMTPTWPVDDADMLSSMQELLSAAGGIDQFL